MLKKFFIIYNSITLAFAIAIAAFKIQWLEMRINIAIIIPLSFAIIAISFCIFTKDKQTLYLENRKLSLGIFISSLVFVSILLKKSIYVVPASIIREGLRLTKVSFSTINIFILIFFISGLILVLFGKNKTNSIGRFRGL